MKKYWKEIIIGLVAGVLNGLFGAGGGSVVVPAMERFLEMDSRRSHATAIGIILVLSLVSSVIYVSKGFFDVRIWALVSVGGIAGGFVGAKLLGRIPKSWLKIGFGIVICITAAKMVL